MALKSFLTNLEGLEDSLKNLYKKTDDGYLLDVDNSDYQQKIGEFRGNNITLKQAKEELEKQLSVFKDVDPSKYQEMKKKLDNLDDKKMLDAGQVDALVEKRAKVFESEYKDKISKLEESLQGEVQAKTTYKTKLDDLAVNDVITKALSDTGKLQKGALADALARAKGVWKVNENGIPVAMNGDQKLYGKDGKDFLSASEWAANLLQKAPFLFEGNRGGGASGGGSSNNTSGKIQIPASQATASSENILAIQKGDAVIVAG